MTSNEQIWFKKKKKNLNDKPHFISVWALGITFVAAVKIPSTNYTLVN